MMRYVFGTDRELERIRSRKDPDVTCVGEKQLYVCGANIGPEIYEQPLHQGFLTKTNREAYDRLQIPELYSGFLPDEAEEKTPGVTFIADVEEPGIYAVRIRILAEEDTEASVYLKNRELLFEGPVKAGQELNLVGLEAALQRIPEGRGEVWDDLSVTVTVAGEGLSLREVETETSSAPAVFVIGDESALSPYGPCSRKHRALWGETLCGVLGEDGCAVLYGPVREEEFLSGDRADLLLDTMAEGDFVLCSGGLPDSFAALAQGRGGKALGVKESAGPEEVLRLMREAGFTSTQTR